MRRVMKRAGWSAGSLGAMVVALGLTAATPGSAKASLCDYWWWYAVQPGACAAADVIIWLGYPEDSPQCPNGTIQGTCANNLSSCNVGQSPGLCVMSQNGSSCTCAPIVFGGPPQPVVPGPPQQA